MKRWGVRTGLVSLIVGLALPLSAEQAPPVPPLDVKGDQMHADLHRHTVIFEGSVLATYGAMTVRCDQLTVFYDATDEKMLGGTVKRAEAEGEVVVTQKDSVAKSRRALLDAVHQTVTLTGDPVVYQGQRMLRGKTIVYHLKTREFEAHGGPAGTGVHFQFVPSPPAPPAAPEPAETSP